MKYLFLALASAILFGACTSNTKEVIPAAPASVTDANKLIKGKKYSTVKLGVLSPFIYDTANPVNWQIQKEDTSKFFRDYAAKQLAFTLIFNNDSVCTYFDTDNDKIINAIYSVDNDAKLGYEEEKPGIKLRIKYADSLDFGGVKTPAAMTQSFLIQGINDKELLLQTSRSINNRKLVVWMKQQ